MVWGSVSLKSQTNGFYIRILGSNWLEFHTIASNQ